MRKPAVAIVAFFCALSAYSLEIGSTSFALQVSPGAQIPVGESAAYYSIVGGLVSLSGEFSFTQQPRIFALAGLEYLLSPLSAGQTISSLAGDLGAGVYLDVTPRFYLKASAGVGYNLSFLNSVGAYTGSGATSGGSLHYTAGIGIGYLLSPWLNVGLGVNYNSYLGLVNGINITLGTSLYLTGREARLRNTRPELQPGAVDLLRAARTPDPGRGIWMSSIEIKPVFPVFRKYYDDHPIGTAVLVNQEKQPVTDVTVYVFIKQYMDAPKACQAPMKLAGGETTKVDLFGLFTDKVLGITEGEKAAAEINIEYRLNDEWYRVTQVETVELLDRNAMTWDDDRRAAAFVTAKDQNVMTFAKNIVASIRDEGTWAFSANLRQAMSIHEALSQYGVKYAVDPKTPFKQYSSEKTSVDYLQFPRQTLQYKAGDCDDLSILYSALLQSVAVDAAFITVPGHIFVAFSLDMTPEEAKKSFADTADLILLEDSAWIPVEITDREGGFVKAWEEGAKQWRDYSSVGKARFYPLQDCWTIYQPVGLPGAEIEIAMPPAAKVQASFQKEMTRFVQKELDPQVKKLEAGIKKTGFNPTLQNRLGVLYAKYGLSDKAEAEFKKILARQEYAPTLVNMGNLYYLKQKWEEALGYYERAAKKSQSETIQLGIARTQHQLGNYGMAKKAYEIVKEKNPAMAEEFAFLEGQGQETARAGVAGTAQGGTAWQE